MKDKVVKDKDMITGHSAADAADAAKRERRNTDPNVACLESTAPEPAEYYKERLKVSALKQQAGTDCRTCCYLECPSISPCTTRPYIPM